MIEPVRQDMLKDVSGGERLQARAQRPRSVTLGRDDSADAPFLSLLLGCLAVTLLASGLLQAFGG